MIRPLQGTPYEQVYSMIPRNEIDIVEQAHRDLDCYNYHRIGDYEEQVRSEAAKEILARLYCYLHRKEEGRDI